MVLSIIQVVLIYALIPIVLGSGSYFIRNILMRISELERQIPIRVTDSQVRQLLTDKLDPLQSDITELKEKLDKIVDILIRK
jgi:hypothetical protein